MPGRRLALLGTLLVTALPAASASAQTHREAVELHRQGDPRALDALARLDEREVQRELDFIRHLARARRRSPREEERLAAYPFAAAALAHTDLAFREDEDGRREAAVAELALARGFLEAGAERVEALARRWHLLLGLRHLERLRLVEAQRVLDDAIAAFPADALLSLAAGAAAQAVALFTPEAARAASTRGQYVRQRMSAAADHRARLQEAEGHLDRALRHDGGLHEAALRLAQVRLALGRPRDAAAALGRVPEGIDPALAYVAHLLRGRSHEKRDEWPAAIESYRRATALRPGAETGWIALARALDHAGERGEAQAALARVFAPDADDAAYDPYRMLPITCAGGSDALWTAMRESVR